MKNLSREVCFKLRDARKAAGVGQTALAAELGCKQSAISMFEQGDGTKLNDEVIEKFAAKFKVSLDSNPVVSMEDQPHSATINSPHSGFCPNPDCPSNHRYEVGGRQFAEPHKEECDPAGGKFCAMCGEVLEHRCPNCGAHLHAGAVCQHCGHEYVTIG